MVLVLVHCKLKIRVTAGNLSTAACCPVQSRPSVIIRISGSGFVTVTCVCLLLGVLKWSSMLLRQRRVRQSGCTVAAVSNISTLADSVVDASGCKSAARRLVQGCGNSGVALTSGACGLWHSACADAAVASLGLPATRMALRRLRA